MTRNNIIQAAQAAALIAGGLLLWKLYRAKVQPSEVGAAIAEAVGSVGGNTVAAFDGAGRALADKVYPPTACAQAMNAEDLGGVLWHCRPTAALDWLTHGRPKGCSVIQDTQGRRVIACPAAPRQSGGASGAW